MPHLTSKAARLLLGFSLLALSSHPGARAQGQRQQQQPTPAADAPAPNANIERGLVLYRQGDADGAVEALRAATKRNGRDADAWYHLGLAYNRADKPKESRKAFEQAVKLRPEDVATRVGLAYSFFRLNKFREAAREAERALSINPRHAEAGYLLGAIKLRAGDFEKALERAGYVLKIDPTYSLALLLKTQALIGFYAEDIGENYGKGVSEKEVERRRAGLKEAEESLEKFVRLNPQAIDAAAWREQLEAIRVFAGAADPADPDRRIFVAGQVDQKAVLHVKPEPGFTTRARENNITGTVKLRMILGADGRVKYILVVRGLPDGLTERALAAARAIKFTPALKDGKPVSVVVTVEYNFNVY